MWLFCKSYLRLDIGSSNQNEEQGKEGNRHIWTKYKENALLCVLEDLVAQGYSAANGQFKPSTTSVIEKTLSTFCPTLGLKVNPHIESKMKNLKKHHSIIFDMFNRSEPSLDGMTQKNV